VYNQLYSVSFSYYASIGFVSTFIIGMAVSMCTGEKSVLRVSRSNTAVLALSMFDFYIFKF